MVVGLRQKIQLLSGGCIFFAAGSSSEWFWGGGGGEGEVDSGLGVVRSLASLRSGMVVASRL